MNNLTLLSRVTSYLDECHNLIGSSKKFGIDRRYQVRCCKAIYFRNTVVKMVNCKYCYIQTKEQWYKEGKLHRDTINPATGLTLPAIIYPNGYQSWYKDGLHHRDEVDPATGLPLPAVIYANGNQSWYKEGVQYYPED